MPLIIQYKSSYGINSQPQPPYTGPVSSWLNAVNAIWHLSSQNGQDADYTSEDLNGSGNVHPVVKTRDVSGGTLLQTNDDFPDLISMGSGTSGSMTIGITVFVVFKQSVGSPNNDSFGVLLQGAGLFIGRGNANNITAKWGVNTPTLLTKNINNDEYVILCFRSDNVNQYLQVNNDTAVSSSDVSGFYLAQKLRVIDNYPANKGVVEVRIYNEFLSGSALQSAYDQLATYLSSTQQAVITFPAIPNKNVGDADFSPGATSNSPAPITYASSNPAVATIVGGNIHIVGPGTTNITASQGATSGYTAADDVTRSFTVNDIAVITFPALSQKTVGEADYSPGATSNSPAPIQYTSSNPAVATIINGKIHLVAAGTTTITATQAATTGFTAAAPVQQSLTVVAASVVNTGPKFPAGMWFMDGVDLYATWSIILEEGSASFLSMPPKKQSTTHDWMDSNGIDVDVSRVFLKERKGVLSLAILAGSEAEFWSKYNQFFSNLLQPGLRRLEFKSHGNRSYYVYYEDNPTYRQVTPIKGKDDKRVIGHRFNITVIEPEPQIKADNVFIVDDAGRFIIT